MAPNGYKATEHDDGSYTIHGVPIFLEGFREQHPDVNFDGRYDLDWLSKALKKAKARQKDGYFPPLHVHHHGDVAMPEAAGTFEITGIRTIRFRGKTRKALVADLHVTNEVVANRVIRGQLPFRSVEIHNVERHPSIDSLALLDSEVPFYELPNLRIAEVEKEFDADHKRTIQPTTLFSQPTRSNAMVAFRRDGHRDRFLFKDTTMSENPNTTIEEFGSGVFDADFGVATIEEGKLTKYEAKGDKFAALTEDEICSAIANGTLSSFGKIKAAIRKAEGDDDDDQPVDDTELPEQMRATSAVAEQMGALRAELRAEKLLNEKFREQVDRDKTVEAAVIQLLPKIGGSEQALREELQAEYDKNTRAGFASYVNVLSRTQGPPTGDPDPNATVNRLEAFSEEAREYADDGPEMVAQAEQFKKDAEELRRQGMRTPVKTYIANRMAELKQTQGA